MMPVVLVWLAWPVGVLIVRLVTRPRPARDPVTVYVTAALFSLLAWVGYIIVTLLLVWVMGGDTAGTDIEWSGKHLLAALLAMTAVTPIVWRIGGFQN